MPPGHGDGRALHHWLDVRNSAFVAADFIALALAPGWANADTNPGECPSLADVAAGVVDARLMRSQPNLAAGGPKAELACSA